MKIEVTKQTRFIIAGVMVGSLIGALGALLLFRQQKSKAIASERTKVGIAEGLSPQRAAALLWHTISVIREIVDFAGK